MANRKKPLPDQGLFRRQAEERLKEVKVPKIGAPSQVDQERLLHELEVHRIELELQNEELLRARQESEAGLERYTELFDFAPIGYATLRGAIIREVNHAGARLLGRDRGTLAGVSFEALVIERDKPAFTSLLHRAAGGERTENCEVVVARAKGAMTSLRLSAIELTRGRPEILLAFEDISERKKREQDLAAAEAALREGDRRKDEFLATLSHELRNPLAPIRNSVFVLGKAEPGSEQSRRAVAVIDRQVTHLQRLIEDLLDVTRIARGKIRLQSGRLELGDLVRRTMDDHRGSFEAGGIRLEGRFDSGLFWVYGDPARLVQVLSNLLGNAEKFTPRGGSAMVYLRRHGNCVVLEVRDTGTGIAPEMVEHVFEPFAQAPQTLDRTRGGLGLGLAMVKGLVELHHGTVGVASEGPGKGTRVTVSLPLDQAPEVTLPDPPKPPVRKRRILAIDDNVDSADTLKEALSFFGHDVQVAYDGPRALALARTFKPEIVFCDIGLPQMDGYAVARAFRSDESLRDVFLIALSGYAQPEDLQKALEVGFERHLAKPPSLEEVAKLLEDVREVKLSPAVALDPAPAPFPD